MPIKTQSDLPAKEILENENIFVVDEYRALHQDIRPLQICILNLMPVKQDTELQILRAFSNTPLQVDVTFVTIKSHTSLNTSANHLNTFYVTMDEIRERNFDGMIITGAPLEEIPFEEVDYWEELCEIMEWSKKNVFSTFHLLGFPGGSVPSLRTAQAGSVGETVRRLRPPGIQPEGAAGARV